MEDVLDLYAEEPDPKRPVVCFDDRRLAVARRAQKKNTRRQQRNASGDRIKWMHAYPQIAGAETPAKES
jgi:hypothetical protein